MTNAAPVDDRIKTFRIDGRRITKWDRFHEVLFATFNFPNYYGRNLNAWIDSMTLIDGDEERLAGGLIRRGDLIVIELAFAKALKAQAPDIYEFIFEGAAFVNGRRSSVGEPPLILVSEYLGEDA